MFADVSTIFRSFLKFLRISNVFWRFYEFWMLADVLTNFGFFMKFLRILVILGHMEAVGVSMESVGGNAVLVGSHIGVTWG